MNDWAQVPGLEAFRDRLPPSWCFESLLDLRLRLREDPWEGPRYDALLVLRDEGGAWRVCLTLEGVTGTLSLELPCQLSGLAVEHTAARGYEARAHWHLWDFEDGGLSLWCQALRAEVEAAPEA